MLCNVALWKLVTLQKVSGSGEHYLQSKMPMISVAPYALEAPYMREGACLRKLYACKISPHFCIEFDE